MKKNAQQPKSSQLGTGPEYRCATMRQEHALDVGRLHKRYMPNSVLAELGDAFLGTLYGSLLETGYGFGFVLLNNDRALGFSFGRTALAP